MRNWDGDVPVDQYDTPATRIAIVRRGEPEKEPGCYCDGDGIRQRVERWETVGRQLGSSAQTREVSVYPIFSTNPDAWEACDCSKGIALSEMFPPRNQHETMFIPCSKCGQKAAMYLLGKHPLCCTCGYADRGMKFIPCIVCGAQSSHNLTTDQPTCEHCWPGKVDR